MPDSEPFRIAAFPDLIARAVIFAITSGRASKIMSNTPMGQLTRSRIRPSSSRVFNDILPTEMYQGRYGIVHHSRQSFVSTAEVKLGPFHHRDRQHPNIILAVVQNSCQAQWYKA